MPHPNHRADERSIEDKALGLLFAMTREQAAALHERLSTMAGRRTTAGERRAAMFVGERSGT